MDDRVSTRDLMLKSNPKLIKRLLELIYVEDLGNKQILDKMHEEGFDLSANQLKYFKKMCFNYVENEQDEAEISQHLLDSLEQVKEKIDAMGAELNAILQSYKNQANNEGALKAIEEIRKLMTLILKFQGHLRDGIKTINARNVMINQNQNVISIVKKMQKDLIREMEPEYLPDQHIIVFRKPKPELIEQIKNKNESEEESDENLEGNTEKCEEA